MEKIERLMATAKPFHRLPASKSTALSGLILALGFFGAMVFALRVLAHAQQPGKIPRIGYMSGNGDANNPGSNVEAFRQGLRDLGYVEGKNILIEYRYAEGKLDQIPSILAELAQRKPDVLVVETLTGIHAAKQATKTIPPNVLARADRVIR